VLATNRCALCADIVVPLRSPAAIVPLVGTKTEFPNQPPLWISPLLEPELAFPDAPPRIAKPEVSVVGQQFPEQVDPLYLFARYLEWEEREEPAAAWDLLAAARSSHDDTRAHARALLANSRTLGRVRVEAIPEQEDKTKQGTAETDMNVPYGLDIIENCTACGHARPDFFCNLPLVALEALNTVSHKSTLPEGAILFVEGQEPRGMFILCAGKVNLSTSSREGKILLLKTAEAGEGLGLSAAISGTVYEATAETATPCHVNFVERKSLLDLMQAHSEVGVQAAACLSRHFNSAYRDIHDLVLSRSSSGKLARLLLSQSVAGSEDAEVRVVTPMTHEEMAHRIGASRETVTRLLSALKKKNLIRLDGPMLVIHDQLGLEGVAG